MGNKASYDTIERPIPIDEPLYCSIPDQPFPKDGLLRRSQSVFNLNSENSAGKKNVVLIKESKDFKCQNKPDFIPPPSISKNSLISKSLTNLTLMEQEESKYKEQMKDKQDSQLVNIFEDQLEKKNEIKQMKGKQILKSTDLKPPDQPENVSQHSSPYLIPVSTKMSVSNSLTSLLSEEQEEAKYKEQMSDKQVSQLINIFEDQLEKRKCEEQTKNKQMSKPAGLKPPNQPKYVSRTSAHTFDLVSVSNSLTSLLSDEQEETKNKEQINDKQVSQLVNEFEGQLEKRKGNEQMKNKQILKPTDLKPLNQPKHVSQPSAHLFDLVSAKVSTSKPLTSLLSEEQEETKYKEQTNDKQVSQLVNIFEDQLEKKKGTEQTKNNKMLKPANLKPPNQPNNISNLSAPPLAPKPIKMSASKTLSLPSSSLTSNLSQNRREESPNKVVAPDLEMIASGIEDNPITLADVSSLKTSIDLTLVELLKTLTHKLFILMNKDGYFSYNHPSHEGVTCDSCENCNFIVDRYKCLICKSYNLCGNCFEIRKTSKQHAKDHPMVRYSAPKEIFGELVAEENVTYEKFKEKFRDIKHETAKCNGCDVEPIIGMRFKCDECPNFNLCTKCFEEKVVKNEHWKDHFILLCFSLRNFDVTDLEFLQELGSGAFGTAHKARLISKDKIVACKVFKHKLRQGLLNLNLLTGFKSFIRELEAYNEFNCNYIIKTYGSSVAASGNEIKLYLLTEYMENGSLTNLLEKEPELSLRCRLLMACNIASGMRRIHEKKFIHRDIRPDNIFVNQHYVAKIGDMGIAKLQDKLEPNTLLGCSRYMPKEFLTRNYNEKLDIYTFGLTLYHLFTGHEHSFENYTITIEEKPIVFNKLIQECLDDDPDKRPTSKSLDKLLNLYYQVLWEVISKCEEYPSLGTSKRRSLFVKVCNSLEENENFKPCLF